MKITTTHALLVLVVLTGVIMASNSYQLSTLTGNTVTTTVTNSGTTKVNLAAGLAYDPPIGTPEIYGTELGVNYDDVDPNDAIKANAAITKLKNLDKSIKLEGADLERYINILYKMENGISCEYCCGARAVIFENGEPACGCAHSYAMRGLTKYLITQHGDKYTDAEILEEAGKWKSLFFPAQAAAKAQILAEQGVETNFINLESNKYRGIEQKAQGGSAGGMVGGC